MTEIVLLCVIIVYILLKDVTVPLVRRLQNGSNGKNPGELHVFVAESNARWEEQRRTNIRFEDNIKQLFDRLNTPIN